MPKPTPTTIRQSSWIVTLSLVAASVAYMAFAFLPNHRVIKQTRQQVETKRMLVSQSTVASDELVRIQREIDGAASMVRKWEKTAPGKRDIPALYGRISTLAKNSRLAVNRFDPQPFVVHEQLEEIPINMTCTGTFGQIHEFIRGIETLPQTIWVESMRLEKMPQHTKNIQCELSLVVFSNNSQASDYTRHAD